MVKFHVTRDKKVWHKGVPQPMDAIIEIEEKQLPHLKGMGYVEGSDAPLEAPRSAPNVDTQAEQTKSGVKK